jgi:hypothetical protein
VQLSDVKLVHPVPGRVRLRAISLRTNPGLVEQVHNECLAVRGIKNVDINPVTGSILITYDALALKNERTQQKLQHLLAKLAPNLDSEKLLRWLEKLHH